MSKAEPKTANEVLAAVREDQNWRHEEMNVHSTGGIQRNIEALWNSLQALADHIDGVATGETDADGVPIKTEPVTTETVPA